MMLIIATLTIYYHNAECLISFIVMRSVVGPSVQVSIDVFFFAKMVLDRKLWSQKCK